MESIVDACVESSVTDASSIICDCHTSVLWQIRRVAKKATTRTRSVSLELTKSPRVLLVPVVPKATIPIRSASLVATKNRLDLPETVAAKDTILQPSASLEKTKNLLDLLVTEAGKATILPRLVCLATTSRDLVWLCICLLRVWSVTLCLKSILSERESSAYGNT